MKNSSSFLPYLALNMTVLVWGLSFVATKIVLESFTTSSLLFIRFSIAACFFLSLMYFRGFPTFALKEHSKIFLAALFQPGLYFMFETTGLHYTTASKASLIIATIPIAVLCLSMLFLHERATVPVIFGIVLSIIGVAMLILGDAGFEWAFGRTMLGIF